MPKVINDNNNIEKFPFKYYKEVSIILIALLISLKKTINNKSKIPLIIQDPIAI